MTNQHPITPPPELVQQWWSKCNATSLDNLIEQLCTQAARWGADQELEACCEWLDRNNQWAKVDIDELRDARRPKPPTLKEQAQAELDRLIALIPTEGAIAMAEPLRRALEALPK